MVVNEEPAALADALPRAAGLLAVGGRLGVIAYHSGEDRLVKRAFRALGGRGFAGLEPAPLTPGADEIRNNPRARSAKLRVLERLEAA
jgi:16S rRNA (cytosine1402-N4)-methyltransferase